MEDATLSGMGTTLTILWPAPGQMIIGQVGDSRAYLLRDGELSQITNDHSMVADMVRKGVLTEEQAACHPMRNYITRAVGTEEDVEMDITLFSRRQGDRWLICSDGLYSMIPAGELPALLSGEDPEAAADRLLTAALEGGGKDNISLVILQDDTETVPPPETETAGEPETENGGEAGSEAPEGDPAAENDPEEVAPQ